MHHHGALFIFLDRFDTGFFIGWAAAAVLMQFSQNKGSKKRELFSFFDWFSVIFFLRIGKNICIMMLS
jgi:hypothetical protein